MDVTLFPPWTFNPRMVFTVLGWVFVKNQPKKSRLDVYNFFLCMLIAMTLVLQKLVSSLDAHEECAEIFLQAWYLDNGALAVRLETGCAGAPVNRLTDGNRSRELNNRLNRFYFN